MRVTPIEQAGFSLAEVAELYNRIFRDYHVPLTISEARLQRQLASGLLDARHCLVAEESGQPVGLLLAGTESCVSHELRVQAMGVIPAARRMGCGRALLGQLKASAASTGVESLRLMVLRSNHVAMEFYRGMGFISAGLRECYLLNLPAHLPNGNNHLNISRVAQSLWQSESAVAATDLPATMVLLAKAGDETVGHLVYSGEETMTMESLYVAPGWRRRRVASSLLRNALAASPLTKKIRLNYLPHTDRGARRFLRRFGFRCYCRLEEMVCPLTLTQKEKDS